MKHAWHCPLKPLVGLLVSLAVIGHGAARAYDLQYRQNNTSFSGAELRSVFNAALPSLYEQAFPQEEWTTYLLLDAHPQQGLVSITLGLSPRLSSTRALLPIATYSVIEPLPRDMGQWRRLLAGVASTYANLMLNNRSRLLMPR